MHIECIEGSFCKLPSKKHNGPHIMLEKWDSYFKDRGLPQEIIDSYLEYITSLTKNNIPVIFEPEHLSKLLGLSYDDLNKIAFGTNKFYREFLIPKRKGGTRLISSPYPSLLSYQKWIYENILKKSKVHFCAHAYIEKKSIISNSKIHLNHNDLLKIDISDFFPSIKISWVMSYFKNIGYSQNVSLYLASLCCLSGSLPQGAATSPALSNILLYSLDSRLYLLSKKFNLKYSRYADDMTFSGEKISVKFISYVESIISNYGFELNNKKTKLIKNKRQKIVTGLDVSGEKLTLPRKKRREIKQSIFYIKKYGLLSHISREKIKDPNYLLSLEGKLQFWNQIEPRNNQVIEMISFIKTLKN